MTAAGYTTRAAIAATPDETLLTGELADRSALLVCRPGRATSCPGDRSRGAYV